METSAKIQKTDRAGLQSPERVHTVLLPHLNADGSLTSRHALLFLAGKFAILFPMESSF